MANVRGCWASAGEGGPCAAGPGPENPGWGRLRSSDLTACWCCKVSGCELGAWDWTAQPGPGKEQTCDAGTSSILRAALWEPARPAGASLHVVACHLLSVNYVLSALCPAHPPGKPRNDSSPHLADGETEAWEGEVTTRSGRVGADPIHL